MMYDLISFVCFLQQEKVTIKSTPHYKRKSQDKNIVKKTLQKDLLLKRI